AQFVTDWKGRQYEHIEYTPYGELWIEETAPGIDKLPFRFTGKELDEETGLYYYGARYLDPKYSRWLSGDPALNDYIPQAPVNDEAKKHNENLPGMGGVFNIVNLHVYHYAGNNPVKYVDPDGRSDSNIWIEMKNAVVPAINFDFGVDYYNLSVQRYNEGNYIEGFLYSVDCLCEAAYDGLIVYTGLKAIGGFIKSAFTTGATGIGKALINLRNADKTVDHIFSKEHIEGGIMKLGSSREDILNKIINVISKVDSNKIIEGSNEIRTVINDSEATIRLFVENGSIINIDAFAGYSNRVFGNLIEGL
ncbi:RHS repeat domain-containing protein, partial [Treponema pedis]|uniref:RHS repeat domain-containing protein n=1 Tax=Treponema pedis TaxID=409322 RepID=UPI0005716FBA